MYTTTCLGDDFATVELTQQDSATINQAVVHRASLRGCLAKSASNALAPLRGIQVRSRGTQRGIGPGSQAVQHPSTDVEPGIIDTAMARRIENKTADDTYPQVRRFAHMFP